MEKVSAMKKVALFLMIVGLAVAMVACQGAVGPQGPKGDDGTAGTAGTDGTDGQPGPSALYKTFDPVAYAVYLNNGEDADSAGDPVEVDLNELFNGGIGEITIGAVTPTVVATADQIFTDDEEDGVVTFSVRLDDDDDPAVTNQQYIVNDYTVQITDAVGPDLTLTLSVRRNQPPGDINLTGFSLGTDDAELMTARTVTNVSCDTNHECTLTVPGEDPNTDTGDELSYAADFDSEAFEVVSIDGAMILFRGLSTTSDGDTTTADDSVEVTITITDAGGLENEATVDVSVDEAPSGSIPAQSIKYSDDGQVLITNLDSFFSDPDGVDTALTYAVKADVVDATVATVAVDNADPPTLTVTPAVASGGTTQVTIVATEPSTLQQSGEATFTLTVNP